MLILAVVAIESRFNPFAQSPMGAQGLMQVMTRVHAERFAEHGGHLAALDPIANMKVGSEILQDLIRRGGSVERGLQLVGGRGVGDREGVPRRRLDLRDEGRIAFKYDAFIKYVNQLIRNTDPLARPTAPAAGRARLR